MSDVGMQVRAITSAVDLKVTAALATGRARQKDDFLFAQDAEPRSAHPTAGTGLGINSLDREITYSLYECHRAIPASTFHILS